MTIAPQFFTAQSHPRIEFTLIRHQHRTSQIRYPLSRGAWLGAILGFWTAAWPLGLWWFAMSGTFYWGSGQSDKWVTELVDTARLGWSSLQDRPFLGWMTNPAVPLLVATSLGALVGAALSAAKVLLRLDEEKHAQSSIAWGFTCWRQPQVAIWFWAFALIPLPTAYILTHSFVELAEWFHWDMASLYGMLSNLWMALFALLVMRRCVVSDGHEGIGWLSNLALHRPATWVGILLWTFCDVTNGALFRFDWILTIPLSCVLFVVGLQLLVRRDEKPLRWKEFLSWRMLSAFFVQDCYFALLLVTSFGPIIALSLLNIFLVPAIYEVCATQGVAVPAVIRFEVSLSSYVATYWWIALPWFLMPAVWILNARLVWQIAFASRNETQAK